MADASKTKAPTVQDRPPVIPQETKPAQENSMVTHILTDADSQLVKMANEGDFDWDAAMQAVEVMDDYTILQDPLELPPECKARHVNDQFRYRWLDPTDRNRFMMQTSGKFPWVVCNRTNAPYIPDVYRDENGLVRKAGMVLAKMRFDLYMARQTRVWKLSTHKEKIGPAKSEGMEFTGHEGGKIRSGDIIVSEEVVNRQGATEFVDVNRAYSGEADRE